MKNTQRRVNAIRNRVRLRSIVLRILSSKARQEQRQPYLTTQAKTIAEKRVETATQDTAASHA